MPHARPLIALLAVAFVAALGCTTTAQSTQPATAAAPEAPDAPFEQVSDTDLLKALRTGGHVVYFRHATTEKDYADQVTADPNNGSTQRVLSQSGWDQAKAIGQAWRDLQLPVGTVTSSQYFRAWQTADLAFGKYTKDPALNFEPAEEYTDEQFEAMRARVQPMLTVKPENPFVNTIIVGHDDPFEASTGIYPEPQGVAYVIKPLGTPGGPGEGFIILARVPSEKWTELAEQFAPKD
ncbi:MAG: histidine phosphatase family protein [Planctomycetota bacterium]